MRAWRPGDERIVEGGVVGGAKAVGLVVFVLVPSFVGGGPSRDWRSPRGS